MTNTYNTGNALGSTDPRDLLDNASNLDDAMNSTTATFTDRLGVQRDTWAGQENTFDLAQSGREAEFQQFLADSGFVSLGNYAPGLNFTAYNQYMARDGFFYRPAPSSIPFTTTGTWVGGDEDLFNLFSTDDVLRQDLGNSADPAKGVSLVARAAEAVADIGELLVVAQDAERVFSVNGYHPGSAIGGGIFVWDSTKPKNEHDGVINFDPDQVFPSDWSTDAQVAAWFTPAVSGSGCFVRLEVSALSPEMAGALPSPANSTRQFAALAAAMIQCATVNLQPGATYRTTAFAAPAYSVINGNYALIERQASANAGIVSTGQHSVVRDLRVDGRQGAGLTGGAGVREVGIAVDSYCLVSNCNAIRSYSHGIGNKSVALSLQYYDITIEDCIAENNGITPGPSGTGDGIGLVNVTRGRVVRCRGDNNARSGVTATTYNTGTLETDVTLSADVSFVDVSATGNGYSAEINAEVVTAPSFVRCRTPNTLTFRSSPGALVDDCKVGTVSGAELAHNPKVINCVITDTVRGYEALNLAGNSPFVDNVRVATTITPATLNLAQIVALDGKGHVTGLTVVGGNNAVRMNVDNFSGITTSGNSGSALVLGASGSTRSFVQTFMPTMQNGHLLGWGDLPTTGTHAVGDRVKNRTPAVLGAAASQYIVEGWVCTVAGTPGTWVAQRTLTGT